MKRTMAISCALILAVASCSASPVDQAARESVSPSGGGGTLDATIGAEDGDVEGTDPSIAATDDDVSSVATEATSTASTTTTRSPVSVTSAPEAGAEDIEPEDPGERSASGEVPSDLFDEVLSHAESLTGVPASDLTVLRAESVTWSDGSLGCPEPGVEYTQALVTGYWVELSAGDSVLDYRLSDRGVLKLCEGTVAVPKGEEDR